MCKVPAHIGIKGNEKVDKAAKDIPGMTTTKLLPDYQEDEKLKLANVVGKQEYKTTLQ